MGTPSKKSNNTPSAPKSSSSTTSAKDLTKGVKSLQLDDPAQQGQAQTPAKTKTMSKNLNVAEEFKKANVKNAANFVVIGKEFLFVAFWWMLAFATMEGDKVMMMDSPHRCYLRNASQCFTISCRPCTTSF